MSETRTQALVDGVEVVLAVVPNVDAAVDTFAGYGFPEVWRGGGGDEHISGAVSLGNADLELVTPRDPGSQSFFAGSLRRGGGLAMLALRTSDIGRAVAGLRAARAPVSEPIFRRGARRNFRFVVTGRSVTPPVACMICQYETPSPRTRSSQLKIKKLDHVVIATADIEDALRLWERNVGLTEDTEMDHPLGAGFKVARLPIGESFLELVQPVEEKGRFYEQFQERGEGLFSISLEVEDLNATVSHLRDRGAKVSEPEPSIWPGARLARINAGSTHGVSIQLIERSSA